MNFFGIHSRLISPFWPGSRRAFLRPTLDMHPSMALNGDFHAH